MNHNEEMKLLGYLKKISDNTGRIADALEKMVPPVPLEVKPFLEKDTHICLTCAHAGQSFLEEPCYSCENQSRWSSKEECE